MYVLPRQDTFHRIAVKGQDSADAEQLMQESQDKIAFFSKSPFKI
jgi:hypothetical protein